MPKLFSQTVVDLGLKLVNEEIDNVLLAYDDSYNKLFAQPEERQRLVDYVMAAIPQVFTQMQALAKPLVKIPYYSLELRLHVENYVHWGIEYIMQTYSDEHLPSDWLNAPVDRFPWNDYTHSLKVDSLLSSHSLNNQISYF